MPTALSAPLTTGRCSAQDAEQVVRGLALPTAAGPDRKQEQRSVMRLAKILVPLAAVVALTLTWSTAASAATINVSPSTVAVGGQVTISGDVLANGQPGCEVPGDVTLTSPAFQDLTAPADSSGNFSVTATLPATTGPGTYKITGRCGGGNLGVSASLTVVGQDVCAEFQSQEDAQAALDHDPGLAQRQPLIHEDHDGIACETLPRRGAPAATPTRGTPRQTG